jgi:aryl-alcohol dehydrogenase-like predicted oxidoreductase
MEYRNLGKSGLKVSVIGLGGNNWGWQIDEEKSVAVINHAIDIGVNFLDTAELYSVGRSEEIIGKAIKGKRSQVLIATKFGLPHYPRDNVKEVPNDINDKTGSRYKIIRAIEKSLQRLDTDYVDLYQMHSPDPTTPIEETLRALEDLIRAGKVRYIGCSNFAGWQLSEGLWTSKICNLNSFVTIQSQYNLLARDLEREVVPCCQAHGIGVIPHSPLAGGFLTGKYHRGERIPAGTRAANVPVMGEVLFNDVNFGILDKLEAFAKQRGRSMSELAIAFLTSQTWISSVIAGATRPEQVSANVAAAEWKLNSNEIAELNSITSNFQNRQPTRPNKS